MSNKPLNVGMTLTLVYIGLPEGSFWRARTVMADGTALEAFARNRSWAAAFLYRKVADHLVAHGPTS